MPTFLRFPLLLSFSTPLDSFYYLDFTSSARLKKCPQTPFKPRSHPTATNASKSFSRNSKGSALPPLRNFLPKPSSLLLLPQNTSFRQEGLHLLSRKHLANTSFRRDARHHLLRKSLRLPLVPHSLLFTLPKLTNHSLLLRQNVFFSQLFLALPKSIFHTSQKLPFLGIL